MHYLYRCAGALKCTDIEYVLRCIILNTDGHYMVWMKSTHSLIQYCQLHIVPCNAPIWVTHSILIIFFARPPSIRRIFRRCYACISFTCLIKQLRGEVQKVSARSAGAATKYSRDRPSRWRLWRNSPDTCYSSSTSGRRRRSRTCHTFRRTSLPGPLDRLASRIYLLWSRSSSSPAGRRDDRPDKPGEEGCHSPPRPPPPPGRAAGAPPSSSSSSS